MLRILATFILIYLLFRVLTAVVFPWIAKWYLRRYRKQFYRDNPWAEDAEKRRREAQQGPGHEQKSTASDKIGEYVDYEDIKDQNR